MSRLSRIPIAAFVAPMVAVALLLAAVLLLPDWSATVVAIGVPVVILAGVLPLIGTIRASIRAINGRIDPKYLDAPFGVATVRSVGQTGTMLNNNPVLRLDVSVTTADGQVFDSVLELLVPLVELHQVNPGLRIPVRYLPGDQSLVVADPGVAPSTWL